MKYRTLGSSGIQISAISFGAGPVPALLTDAGAERHREVVGRALDAGINWFDTAAAYGDGQSESSLGAALQQLGALQQVHVATKVRLLPEDLSMLPSPSKRSSASKPEPEAEKNPKSNVAAKVRHSVSQSLQRLGRRSITLLQLHNAITSRRGEEPASVTPQDVLGPGGVLEAFRSLQAEGLVEHLGITALGQAEAMREVIRSGQFAAAQIPFNVLNPSGGRPMPANFDEVDYGDVIADCARQQMGVLAIRVLAGGALAGQAPSAHTKQTRFFPIDLYHRDAQRSQRLQGLLPPRTRLPEVAIRYALGHQHVSSAIVGFAQTQHVAAAVAAVEAGALPEPLQQVVDQRAWA